jgi:predicted nucleotidyltransferase
MAAVASKWRLRYLVIFGSRARSYEAPHSDGDVAVKAGRRLSMVERGSLYTALQECVRAERLDLVIIDDWDPIVAWESLSRGRLVYYCGGDCLKEYYWDLAKALDGVADLEPLIEVFQEENLRALSRLGGEGRQG